MKRTIKHIIPFAVFSLLVTLSSCDGQTFNEPDYSVQEDAIIHGTPDTSTEHLGVVLLYYNYGYGNYGFCTGTLISPQYVLTASHCIKNYKPTDDIESYRPYMKVGVGYSETNLIASYEISEFHPHPNYIGSDYYIANDVAIIKLKKPVPTSVARPIPPLPPSKAYTRSQVNNGKVKITYVGFGLTNPSDDYSSGTKYKATAKLDSVCTKLESSKDCTVGYSMTLPLGTILHWHSTDGSICSGDSGGPALYVHDGIEYVTGVSSYGDQYCSTYDVSMTTFDFYNFIEQYVSDLPAEDKEDCFNGIDDNGDGRIDCEDPYCLSVTKCLPEICDNDVDDNENGLKDCDDPDCFGARICQPEICDNDYDDNGDGLIDCDDPQCSKAPKCQPEICDNGIDDNENGLKDCEESTCAILPMCHLEVCDNGIDDNENGLLDCLDPQCSSKPVCIPEICNNGIDDNGDGAIDCEDIQCISVQLCWPEICYNGVDDNLNGLIDCDDPQCANDISCKAEICDNRLDDNNNGLVDCDDPGCAESPACLPEEPPVEEGCSATPLMPSHPAKWLGLLLFVPLIFSRKFRRVPVNRKQG